MSTEQQLAKSPHQRPSLPIPSLEATLTRYRESLCAVLSGDELANGEASVDAFQASPLAAKLQSALEARASISGNWLEEWWEQMACEWLHVLKRLVWARIESNRLHEDSRLNRVRHYPTPSNASAAIKVFPCHYPTHLTLVLSNSRATKISCYRLRFEASIRHSN